jgi:hypothetical protein
VGEALPDFLTHYYKDRPFRTLSDLPSVEVAPVLERIAAAGDIEFRLTREEYLPRRRDIEAVMRTQFAGLGGKPTRANPHYAILGTFSLYEDDPYYRSETLPLASLPTEAVSFTFTDSFFAFSDANLRGVRIPERPYHGRVYRLEDLPALVGTFGLPGERWRTEPGRRFDVYIEAQIWDDAPILGYLNAGS